MQFDKHQSYIIGVQLSNYLWQIINKWDDFNRDTLGKQLQRAADSISSNIAEGWNRYYKKDKILFLTYAKSSFYESLDWINKALARKLINQEERTIIKNMIQKFPKEINGLIKGIKMNLKK